MRSTLGALSLIGMLVCGGAVFAAPTTSPAAGTAAQPTVTSRHSRTATTSGTTTPAVPGKGNAQSFDNEQAANRACGAANVVWANRNTKVYHLSGDKYFGHTKRGSFMCQSAAKADGYRQSGTSRTASRSG